MPGRRQPGAPPWAPFDGGSPWAGIASAVMDGLNRATEPQRYVADQLVQFVGNLNRNAMPWFVNIPNEQCTANGCRAPAVLHCVACGSAVCLAHAHISHTGRAVCDNCVESILSVENPRPRARRAPPPPNRDDRVRDAMRVLGVKRGESMAEITRRYRKLAAQNHPDRARNETQRERMQSRMSKINEAYHVLKEHYREAA